MLRPLKKALISQGVDYRTVGLIKNLRTKEVKRYFSLFAFGHIIPADKVSFQRIFNIRPVDYQLKHCKK